MNAARPRLGGAGHTRDHVGGLPSQHRKSIQIPAELSRRSAVVFTRAQRFLTPQAGRLRSHLRVPAQGHPRDRPSQGESDGLLDTGCFPMKALLTARIIYQRWASPAGRGSICSETCEGTVRIVRAREGKLDAAVELLDGSGARDWKPRLGPGVRCNVAARDQQAALQAQKDQFDRSMALQQQQHDQFLANMAAQQRTHQDQMAVLNRGSAINMARTQQTWAANHAVASDWVDTALGQRTVRDSTTGQLSKVPAGYGYTWIDEPGKAAFVTRDSFGIHEDAPLARRPVKLPTEQSSPPASQRSLWMALVTSSPSSTVCPDRIRQLDAPSQRRIRDRRAGDERHRYDTGPARDAHVFRVIHWRAGTDLGRSLDDRKRHYQRRIELCNRWGTRVGSASLQYMLHDRPEQGPLLLAIGHGFEATEYNNGPIVHGVVEGGSRQHQPIDQGHADTSRHPTCECAQKPAPGRTVDRNMPAHPSIIDGQCVGLAAPFGKRNVAEERFVQDGIDERSVIGATGRKPPQGSTRGSL